MTVEGKSIQEVIYEFIQPNPNATFNGHAQLLIDECSGPNCVPKGQSGGNTVQSLIEIENTFTPVPIWLIVFVSLFLYGVATMYMVMASMKSDARRVSSEAVDRTILERSSTKSFRSGIYLRGLSVESQTGEKILENVNLSLGGSTLNCLLGKSGSGKSTLLGVLR